MSVGTIYNSVGLYRYESIINKVRFYIHYQLTGLPEPAVIRRSGVRRPCPRLTLGHFGRTFAYQPAKNRQKLSPRQGREQYAAGTRGLVCSHIARRLSPLPLGPWRASIAILLVPICIARPAFGTVGDSKSVLYCTKIERRSG